MRFDIIRNPTQLKPLVIPDDFVVIQDSREQVPLFERFNGNDLVKGELPLIRKALKFGDYSIRGFEDRFVVERKMLSDFYSYIGNERKQTTHKMEQFREIIKHGGFVGLVIEASEAEILSGHHMSKVAPEVARQALVSFEVRYGCHTYCNHDRDCLRRWILDRSVKFFRIQREVSQ